MHDGPGKVEYMTLLGGCWVESFPQSCGSMLKQAQQTNRRVCRSTYIYIDLFEDSEPVIGYPGQQMTSALISAWKKPMIPAKRAPNKMFDPEWLFVVQLD